MEIKRDAYLEQLKIRKDNGMIKIITGIRRCGKSFLLFVLFKKYLYVLIGKFRFFQFSKLKFALPHSSSFLLFLLIFELNDKIPEHKNNTQIIIFS